MPNTESKSLLIGNSLIRNVTSSSSNLSIECLSGATFASLSDRLSQKSTLYDNIFIVAGTTDCSDSKTTTAKIQILLAEAKKHCRKVVFSSVLPRMDPNNQGFQLKIDHVNESLKQVCHDNENCDYVENDGSFKLADITPNDAMFVKDGYHLNTKGALKLLENLNLTKKTTVSRPKPSYSPMYMYGNTVDQTQIVSPGPDSTPMATRRDTNVQGVIKVTTDPTSVLREGQGHVTSVRLLIT